MAARKKGGGSRKGGASGKGLTPNKAREMLHEHKFSSPAQQRFLGAKSEGSTVTFPKKKGGKKGRKR